MKINYSKALISLVFALILLTYPSPWASAATLNLDDNQIPAQSLIVASAEQEAEPSTEEEDYPLLWIAVAIGVGLIGGRLVRKISGRS